MVDTGLMRKDEFKYTYKAFKEKYGLNVKLINASKIFLKKLKNISNPMLVDWSEKFSEKMMMAMGTNQEGSNVRIVMSRWPQKEQSL